MSTRDASERRPLPPFALPLALALVPLLYLVWTGHRLHVDVPIGDEWEMVARFDKFESGTLRLYDVWRQHNEHRPMFPILYMLVLGRATGWNTGAEIASSFVMAIVTFLVCMAPLVRTRAGRPQWTMWLLPLASLLYFSTVQWENWIQGWQLGLFMGVMFSTVGLRLLSGPDPTGLRLGAALAAGVVATYSFGAGITYWIAGLFPMFVNRAQRSAARWIVWTVVAGLTIASYMYDYHGNSDAMRSNFASVRAFARMLWYVPAYLGGPVASVWPPMSPFIGIVVLVAYVMLMARLWSKREDTHVLFPAVLGLNAIGIATLTALGRAIEWMPTSSRYTTMAIPFWLSVTLLLAYAVQHGAVFAASVASRRVAAGAIAGVFSVLVILSGARPMFWAKVHHDIRAEALLPLIRGDELPTLGRLYANDGAEVLRRREVLKRLRLSVFRPGRYKQ